MGELMYAQASRSTASRNARPADTLAARRAVAKAIAGHGDGQARAVASSGYSFSRVPIYAPGERPNLGPRMWTAANEGAILSGVAPWRLQADAGVLQTKLAINTPGDEHEQEADRISEQMMRMPEPQVQLARTCGGRCRTPQAEPFGHERERLQTKNVESGDVGRTDVPPIVHEVLRSPSQPLGTATRSLLEPRFGHDFSRVRVHTDARAADSARVLGALAYTVGRDVVFGAEQYAPGTAAGRRLLAHELTHVVQQSSAGDNSGRVVMRQPQPVESTFSGCTENQSNQINAVVQNAKRALAAAAGVIGSAYGRPSGLSAAHQQLLMVHFHTTSHDDLRKILGTYVSIERAFDSGLKFQCEATCSKTATSNVCGYAYNTMLFGGSGPIHICFDTAGCDFATTAARNRVALVIHEASHRHAGVDDKVYVWEPGYATLSAKDALDNADSYAWFAVNV